MTRKIIKDWTQRLVVRKAGGRRPVRYTVYRDGEQHFQKIHDENDVTIRRLELPAYATLDQQSFEVLLAYAIRHLKKP